MITCIGCGGPISGRTVFFCECEWSVAVSCYHIKSIALHLHIYNGNIPLIPLPNSPLLWSIMSAVDQGVSTEECVEFHRIVCRPVRKLKVMFCWNSTSLSYQIVPCACELEAGVRHQSSGALERNKLTQREHADCHNLTNGCSWFSVLLMLYLAAILLGVFVLDLWHRNNSFLFCI
jgi:hypothetical protein